ncbi:MAG: SDR family NAD(P)-dependent oxidoreductase [Hymenobacter sp.]
MRDRAAVEAAVAGLPAEFAQVDVLINNAGNAHGLAPIQDGDVADWDAMLDGNVQRPALREPRALLPRMTARRSSIVNIGSIAGHEAYANGNVYCASKAAVAMLTQHHAPRLATPRHPGGRGEPRHGRNRVFSKSALRATRTAPPTVYQGLQPLQATDIADLIQFIVTRPPHVADCRVVIFPAAQAAAATVRRA